MIGECDGCGANDTLLMIGGEFLCVDCINGDPEDDFDDEIDDLFDRSSWPDDDDPFDGLPSD